VLFGFEWRYFAIFAPFQLQLAQIWRRKKSKLIGSTFLLYAAVASLGFEND